VSKKADKIMDDRDDEGELLPPEDEPTPARDTSADKPTDAPGPRMARFGEGAEGRAARRGRGAAAAPRANFFERLGQFWRDIRSEMKRVTWPTASEVKNTTLITVVAVIFFALYLFAVDQVLAYLIIQLERLVSWLVGAV